MFVPENEMGVIVYFSQRCSQAGYNIEGISASYPDAIISKNDKIYYVEFEYQSHNFAIHKHNPLFCDFIICWEHNDYDLVLPVLELSNKNWINFDINNIEQIEKSADYWKRKYLDAH